MMISPYPGGKGKFIGHVLHPLLVSLLYHPQVANRRINWAARQSLRMRKYAMTLSAPHGGGQS
jgi:hypothetical protein